MFLKIRSLLSRGINNGFKSAASDSFENISYGCWSVAENNIDSTITRAGKFSVGVKYHTEG